MADPTTQDNIRQLLSDLPAPIKRFLTEDLSGIVQEISQKHDFHIDQAGTLERDLMLVLLGAREPAALAANLKEEAHLDDPTLTAVLNEVNEQIFMPLREQLRKAAAVPAATFAGAIVHPPLQAPTKPVAPQQPVTRPAAPPPENLPGVMQPKQQMPAPSAPKPLADALKAAGVPLASPQASKGAVLLEDHEEPHIDIKKPAIAPAPVAPPPIAPPPAMPKPAVPPMPSAPPAAPVKAYAVDPYREQPEEQEK